MRTKSVLTAAAVALLASMASAPASVAQEDDPFALSSLGDATKGKRVYLKCRACHNVTGDKRPRTGPNLDNLFGRKAGTSENYTRYSKALQEADFVWTEQLLDEWLQKPNTFLPGNKMQFAGLRKEQDRRDLMAYLREATVSE